MTRRGPHAAPGAALDLAWDHGAATAAVVLPPVYRGGNPAERGAALLTVTHDPAVVARAPRVYTLEPPRTAEVAR